MKFGKWSASTWHNIAAVPIAIYITEAQHVSAFIIIAGMTNGPRTCPSVSVGLWKDTPSWLESVMGGRGEGLQGHSTGWAIERILPLYKGDKNMLMDAAITYFLCPKWHKLRWILENQSVHSLSQQWTSIFAETEVREVMSTLLTRYYMYT